MVDRAHYLTLWSRFGPYSRTTLDDWLYGDKLAHEFWGHEASLLPQSRLPMSRRFMRDWEPQSRWWDERFSKSPVKRRVLRRIREEGPLESAQFEAQPGGSGAWWGWKDSKMALEWLWRKGRLAVRSRRHFRRVYDLAERVYPEGGAATRRAYEESWALDGLAGNGLAPPSHLENYITAPRLPAETRRQVLARLLKRGEIVALEMPGSRETWYALPEHLEGLARLARPRGTNLICPFDSLLWQRRRAEDLLAFRYRIEIYVPKPKRVYGYYVLPILHEGRFVGRLDPKFDRQAGCLRIHAIHLEPGIEADASLRAGLGDALGDLARFLGADTMELPKGWRRLAG